MRKYLLTVVSAVLLSIFAHAQYVDNALLFSQQYFGGTARSEAMGNAFGSLGGDFASLSINPAGIGVYRSSEFMFTPNVMHYDQTEATYQGFTVDETEYKFNFNNFGFVGAFPAQSEGAVVSFNFGMGMNRLNNFNQNALVMAYGSPHSMTDYFALNANNNGYSYVTLEAENRFDVAPWKDVLAWNTFLIDTLNNEYISLLNEGEKVDQRKVINRTGRNDEYVFSFGANFNHRVYLGAALGIQDIYFKETSTYTEEFQDGGGFDYDNYLKVNGTGVNFKVGAIVRATDFLRLGVAFHTPTFLNLEEEYYSDMYSYLDEDYSELSPLGFYEYDLETPMRLIGSAALVFAKNGLLSVDYEYTDYSRMKLRRGSDGYQWFAENQEIKTRYQATHNFRVGAEVWALPFMAVRGGWQYYGNPFKSTIDGIKQPNSDYNHMVYSAGLGFKGKSAYFDIAYKLSDHKSYNYLYSGFDDPVQFNRMTHDLMFTLGFKF